MNLGADTESGKRFKEFYYREKGWDTSQGQARQGEQGVGSRVKQVQSRFWEVA